MAPKRILYLILALSFGLQAQTTRTYRLPPGVHSSDIYPDVVVVKLNPDAVPNQPLGNNRTPQTFQSILQTIPVKKIKPFFQRPNISINTRVNPSTAHSSLERIYKIELQPGSDVLGVVNKLLQSGQIEYAEPYYRMRPLFIPDDPFADPVSGSQDYLSLINAYEGWDIEQGDTSIVIGILDTGVQPDHSDLQGNLQRNFDDPPNGLDDDNDGLVDNYTGYDFADNDNDPLADLDEHGTQVTGVSSASTNNGQGIAGIGFNSRYVPLKIFQSVDNEFANGYEAIVHAAEKGMDVINLSWGAPNAFQQFAQDIIEFAVLEKDVVVVAAAGNTDAELDFYPAAYNYVLSVGASSPDDEKADFATFSHSLDLVAPGVSNFTTFNDDNYGNASGSSFSSPIVAGAAALLRARFPQLNAIQIMEQLRITADDIYDLPSNQPFFEKLGKGRVNIQSAISDTLSPAIRMDKFTYDNGIGMYAFYDDTVEIIGDFTNYLKSSPSALVSVSSLSENVQLLDSTYLLGDLSTLETNTNANQPFKIYLTPNTPPNDTLIFRLGFEDIGYDDFQYFEIVTPPEFITLENGQLSLTAGSAGKLGFNLDSLKEGIGLAFQDQTLVDHIGVLITDGETRAPNNIVNDFINNTRDESFQTTEHVKLFGNSIASTDVRASFNDENAGADELGVKLEEKILGFQEIENQDFLIVEYRAINTSTAGLSDIHLGLYTNWNLGDTVNNKADWDPARNMGYVYDALNNDLYAGVALLTAQMPAYHAIDNANFNGNTAELGDTFSKTEKFNFISNGVSKTQAGVNGTGNDISHLFGATISQLDQNQFTKVAFTIVAGNSLSDIRSKADQAASKYTEYLSNPPVLADIPVCPETQSTITLQSGDNFEFYADPQGMNLIHSGNGMPMGPLVEDSVIYVANIDQPYKSDIRSVIIRPAAPVADFDIVPDTLFLGDNNQVQFIDLSFLAASWEWDFQNGFASTARHPVIPFDDPGLFTVKLKVETNFGCTDSLAKDLVVLIREPAPIIADQSICRNTITSVTVDDTTILRIYTDPALENMVFQGTSFTTGPIPRDTIFFITVLQQGVESEAEEVNIDVNGPILGFQVIPDTTNFTDPLACQIVNTSEGEAAFSWFLDGIKFSEANAPTFIVKSENSFAIQLKSESMGCSDSLQLTFQPEKSPIPQINDIMVCRNENILLKPENGTFFNFYADANLNTLLHKGKVFQAGTLDSTTQYFVTGMDSLLESEPADVTVEVDTFSAKFSLEPEQIILSGDNKSLLTHQSDNAISWTFIIDRIHFSGLSDSLLQFEFPGEHTIELIASNASCTDTLSKKLQVLQITGMDDVEDEFSLYPNPVEEILLIRSIHPIEQMEIYTQAGRKVNRSIIFIEPNKYIVDLSLLPPGGYILKIISEGRGFVKRVLKM